MIQLTDTSSLEAPLRLRNDKKLPLKEDPELKKRASKEVKSLIVKGPNSIQKRPPKTVLKSELKDEIFLHGARSQMKQELRGLKSEDEVMAESGTRPERKVSIIADRRQKVLLVKRVFKAMTRSATARRAQNAMKGEQVKQVKKLDEKAFLVRR